jgi:hypothetical protein
MPMVFVGAVGCGWAQPANTSGRIASNFFIVSPFPECPGILA